jgi:predicted dehydrogenase
MTEPLRAALIGCGAISTQHLAYLTAADTRAARLVGVCDLSAAAAEYTAQRHGTVAFTDAAQMLQQVQPDVVHVLTPPRSHRPLVELALQSGAHVICEKPIATSSADLASMLSLADSAGLTLTENHNYLFNDPVQAVDRIVAEGRIGEVVEVDVLFALGVTEGGRFVDPNVPSPVAHLAGGAVHDFLTHLSYLALHFLGAGEPTAVTARWRNLSGKPQAGFDDLSAEFEVGQRLGAVRFTAVARPECATIRVRGTKGTVETDLYQPYLKLDVPRSRAQLSSVVNQVVNGVSLAAAGGRGLRNKVLQHTPYHGLPRFLAAFYGSLRGGPAPVSRADLVRTTALIDALIAGQGAS